MIRNTEAFKELSKKFRFRKYRKGEMLIRSDDDPLGTFCLTSGYVRKYVISPEGSELTFGILKPISIFPRAWTINNIPNVYNFEAMTEVAAGIAPREVFVKYIKNKPSILFELLSSMVDNYAEILSRVEYLALSDAYHRVVYILIYLAKNFGEKFGQEIRIKLYFTHQGIAALTGISRETVSMGLNRLFKKKLIRYYDRHIVIINIEKLAGELPRISIQK